MKCWAIFLDDGGVMNDNRLRGEQWRRLVGKYFAPRLGGSPKAWAEANRAFTDELFEPAHWSARLAASPHYEQFDERYQLDWLTGMCRRVGVAFPSAEEAYALARDAAAYVTRRVRSAFPGATVAIRELHGAGYTLHTASGEPSWDLDGYLNCMGVRDCFTRLYGPDLIDTHKAGPAYYDRMFADAVVDPAHALVVDDSAQAVAWAREAGARAVQVVKGGAAYGPAAIPSLAELPAWLAAVE